MRITNKLMMAALGLGLGFNAAAQTTIPLSVTTDTAYTAADNPIFLSDGPTYVTNGASLTFGPGCVVVNLPARDGGIVITRGAQIFVNGTKDAPVIMTSAQDVETWTGSQVVGTGDNITDVIAIGDPKTGVHRQAHQEWRNITILGNAVISASEFGGAPRIDPDTGLPNPSVPDGTASSNMEGLEPNDAPAGSPAGINAYGGSDDDDDSGSMTYLSLRYTGRVLGEGNELNGISLGGLGRETDFSHFDLMNNVDDGIEIWGGTLNVKYFNVWNVGDDSFDVDQGWRGKVQFGLIVQGYSDAIEAQNRKGASKVQGSGVGDNIFEMDGAEQSDVQPFTTSVIYNVTAIGMPNGDGATTWRDGARVQFRNMLFVDIGEELVRNDGDDGDGGEGYGNNGTLPFFDAIGADVWDTPASTLPTVGAGTGAFAPANLYSTQVDGNLAEISDSLIFDGTSGATGASGGDLNDSGDFAFLIGVLGGTPGSPTNSATFNNVYTSTLPIAKYDRSGVAFTTSDPVSPKTWTLLALNGLDPRPVAAEALTSVGTAPLDGFFVPAPYRGGFSADNNWAEGWTAADAYGFFANTGTNPTDPAGATTITLAAKLSFPTEDGVFYTVSQSTDGGASFSPFAIVEGDGTVLSVADLDDFDASKLYKVEVQ